MRYAFFDLDHTLLPFDTQALFCNHVIRREPWRILYLLVFIPVVPFAALKLVGSRTLKRIFMSYLWRMPKERLEKHVADFVRETAIPWIYPELIAEIERHRRDGRTLVLTTASPGFYGRAIGEALKFEHIFATHVTVPDRMPLIPEVVGSNNKRKAKIVHMAEGEILPEGFDPKAPYPISDSYSYTDSAADAPLLEIAEFGFLIHPDSKLAAAASPQVRTTLFPKRPYNSKLGDMWAAIRQSFGLYGRANRPPVHGPQTSTST